MTHKTLYLKGPTIIYLTSIITLTVLYITLSGLITPGVADITENSRMYLRISGRAGMFLLLLSFCASPLHKIFKSKTTHYLLQNRRYLGISTAIVLWSHFLVLLSMRFSSPVWFQDGAPWFILLPGSIVFILVGAMALTSNNYSQNRMGRKRWKTLHLIGGYTAAAAFIGEYILTLYLQPIILPDYHFSVSNNPILQYSLFFVAISILLLRLIPFRKNRL